jgi:hypothetical protein
MRRILAGLSVIACCVAAAACSRASSDDSPPVATPAVTIDRDDTAVGSPVDVTYKFTVAQGAAIPADDYTVFVHFLDPDGELLWTDDHQPPTPVRQWKSGETVQYTRTVFVPKVPYTGQTNMDVGIYAPASGKRLPLQGENDGMRAYRVGRFNIHLQSDSVFVVFKDGWHETEVADQASGLEWQWSKKEGTASFRNPHRDVELFLDVDQPVTALPAPQHVAVRIGSATVDSFELPPSRRVLRRLTIPAAQLGSNDTVEMAVAVDPTFVPASVPQLKSNDARELGIRVFHLHVQPK